VPGVEVIDATTEGHITGALKPDEEGTGAEVKIDIDTEVLVIMTIVKSQARIIDDVPEAGTGSDTTETGEVLIEKNIGIVELGVELLTNNDLLGLKSMKRRIGKIRMNLRAAQRKSRLRKMFRKQQRSLKRRRR
jgi:hypothetical protein